jgi:hypothetical protein
MWLIFLAFFGSLFLICVYSARASIPKLADLCYYAGPGEASNNARSGLRIHVRSGPTSVSTRRDRSLPEGVLPELMGTGYFEVWTDPRPTPWIAGLLGRQIWQASKDGRVIIPYELTAQQERGEGRFIGPFFLLFFGAMTALSAWALVTGH